MRPQITCLGGCILTLVAFVQLFSAVCFQMCPLSPCIIGCKFALVAFVRLFSTVRFHMCLQIPCLNRCKFALVAFVWLFSTVPFQMSPQIICLGRAIVTLVASNLFTWKFRFQIPNVIKKKGPNLLSSLLLGLWIYGKWFPFHLPSGILLLYIICCFLNACTSGQGPGLEYFF